MKIAMVVCMASLVPVLGNTNQGHHVPHSHKPTRNLPLAFMFFGDDEDKRKKVEVQSKPPDESFAVTLVKTVSALHPGVQIGVGLLTWSLLRGKPNTPGGVRLRSAPIAAPLDLDSLYTDTDPEMYAALGLADLEHSGEDAALYSHGATMQVELAAARVQLATAQAQLAIVIEAQRARSGRKGVRPQDRTSSFPRFLQGLGFGILWSSLALHGTGLGIPWLPWSVQFLEEKNVLPVGSFESLKILKGRVLSSLQSWWSRDSPPKTLPAPKTSAPVKTEKEPWFK
mmetsp:Transcript_64789/g.146150  ORF Transcript_64789/g.146150 Transcript_64789/m.146150 type:complete len:284 (+) Transcript_64789:121-972(+)|eukprot:CAMPEP_0172604690 /NCGR_PEP_ID=MMETSP1068-20121228/24943_1 /TAXON_ID=35684 /ORGANISM="Pseudopedinella elastica, Strain CCMP716" /LENGTH=283 /DNA_ID=CAMNT_0013406847 /DNA_START=97 /DNA_END=948 /DNA_ORIENTATION=-